MPGKRSYMLAVAAVVALSGCGSGGDGTIPSDESDQLTDLLAATKDRVAAGDCDLAFQNARELATLADTLPPEVDREVQQGLVEAAANLVALVDQQCEQTTGASGFEDAQSTTPTTTEADTTETTDTTTTTDDEPAHDGQPSEPGGGEGNEPPPAPDDQPPPDEPPPSGDQGGGGGGTGGTGGTITPGGGQGAGQ